MIILQRSCHLQSSVILQHSAASLTSLWNQIVVAHHSIVNIALVKTVPNNDDLSSAKLCPAVLNSANNIWYKDEEGELWLHGGSFAINANCWSIFTQKWIWLDHYRTLFALSVVIIPLLHFILTIATIAPSVSHCYLTLIQVSTLMMELRKWNHAGDDIGEVSFISRDTRYLMWKGVGVKVCRWLQSLLEPQA